MPSYPEVGDTQTLSLDVTDAAGAPTDPASLVLTIYPPTGAPIVETHPHSNISHPSTGAFRRLLSYSEDGMWAYRWTTTSPTMGEGERIYVRLGTLDALPRSLSLEELKRRVDKRMDIDEDMLADDLAAAFLQAQKAPPFGTGRLLAPDPARDSDPVVTRTVPSSRRRMRIPDAREITAVTLDGSAVTDYTTLSRDGVIVQLSFPDNGDWISDRGEPWEDRTAIVTGRFGFVTIPEDLAGVIYQLAARWHYERQAQYADQVEVLEGTAVQAYYRQIPPRVQLAFRSWAIPSAVGGLR